MSAPDDLPDPVQKAYNAADAAIIKIAASFIWSHKQQVEPEDIRAKGGDIVVGIDDIAPRLGDLDATGRNGSIGAETLEWDLEVQMPQIVERHRDEAYIHQVQQTMLRPTDIHVHRQPFL